MDISISMKANNDGVEVTVWDYINISKGSLVASIITTN